MPGDPSPIFFSGARIATAYERALAVARNATGLLENIRLNFREGLMMICSILPSIMSVGLLGLLLAKHTPVFDWLGYVFYPVPPFSGSTARGNLPGHRPPAWRKCFCPHC